MLAIFVIHAFCASLVLDDDEEGKLLKGEGASCCGGVVSDVIGEANFEDE